MNATGNAQLSVFKLKSNLNRIESNCICSCSKRLSMLKSNLNRIESCNGKKTA